ncbi:MAG TPA: DUF4192 domain-containing protein [Nocardioidaceae bacterium]|nr:DUF4192 domain-containing protein [Nocardioidaceae bacterium]
MNTRPPIRIKSPTDLLALIPCALGFHPEESIVLVVTAGGAGQLHARLDLPADEDEVTEVARTLLHAAAKAEAHQVALVAYSGEDDWVPRLVDLLALELELADVEVMCAIRADGERWHSLDCDEACGALEGEPYDLTSHPITAQSVLDGKVTYLNRRALVDSLVGTDLEAIDAVGEASDEAMRSFRAAGRHPLGMDNSEGSRAHMLAEGYWVRERVRRYVRTGEPLDHHEVGRMVVAMVNIEVRDVAWAEMTRETSTAHVELWRDVVRRTPLDLLAGPAALLGFAAWLAGDGALAWCAVERCQEAEPGYSLAGLVSQALSSALHPSTWQPIPAEDLPLFAG